MVKKSKGGAIKRSGKIFFYTMIALPVLQFLIFYVYVNFNSFLMGFQNYDNSTGQAVITWTFDNFKKLFSADIMAQLRVCLKNSLIYFGVSLINVPISMLFAYYIYKRYRGSEFFKIVLFMPSIVCVSALAIFYRYFVNNGIGSLTGGAYIGPDFKEGQQFVLVLFFAILNLSSNILLYINAFSRVSDAVVEAAEVDGANEWQVFLHVVIPEIYGSVVSILIISLGSIATNQAYLFLFFGGNANPQYQTLGYYLFCLVQNDGSGALEQNYRFASALGLLLTLIVTPITILARKLLIKHGPSED